MVVWDHSYLHKVLPALVLSCTIVGPDLDISEFVLTLVVVLENVVEASIVIIWHKQQKWWARFLLVKAF